MKQTLELPDVSFSDGQLLMDVVYNGVVEATMDELRELILLARHLHIAIPVSNDLLKTLDIPPPPPKYLTAAPKNKLFPPPMKRSKPVTGNNSVANRAVDSDSVPLPPPLKRIREDLPHLSVVPNRGVSGLVGQSQQQQHPQMFGNKQSSPKEYLCPFCNSRYNNLGNFKQHMRFHESEAVKEERSQMMNEMVATSFSKYYSRSWI